MSTNYKELSNALRFLSIDMVNQANSGHPGMPLGMADIVTVLFKDFMHFNPDDPLWPNRDRFVLSNGHGSALLYSLLHLTGYDVHLDDLKNFRQFGSLTAGHPEFGALPGIETTTGPLGQGIANAVGMAFAQKIMAAKHGTGLFDNYTYVTVGDGCLMEGISHEACEFAGHHKLNKLIVLFDDNGISIDGATKLTQSTDITARFKAYGFQVLEADGHNTDDIHAAIKKAKTSKNKPTLIRFKTTIGLGSPLHAGKSSAHGSPLGQEEREQVAKAFNWQEAPFDIPEDIRSAWLNTSDKSCDMYIEWLQKWQKLPASEQLSIQNAISYQVPDKAFEALDNLKETASQNQSSMATRKAIGACLEAIAPHMPELISGSADLTPSNNTQTQKMAVISADDASGQYVHYGIREHAMAAIMNGLQLYGGLRPCGGTFLSFLDYMKPAVRLSALMEIPVQYIFTHDSIGLGEDGPTHQPIEHLASLRAIPNLYTYRPADLTETIECLQIGLEDTFAPSAYILSRQNLPALRNTYTEENFCRTGAYILSEPETKADVVLIASGSEVHLCLEAQQKLKQSGIQAKVVSMPCVELFEEQDDDTQAQILSQDNPNRIFVEAASSFGLDRYVGDKGAIIAIDSFGSSAPAEDLYQNFGLTVENICETAQQIIENNKIKNA